MQMRESIGPCAQIRLHASAEFVNSIMLGLTVLSVSECQVS